MIVRVIRTATDIRAYSTQVGALIGMLLATLYIVVYSLYEVVPTFPPNEWLGGITVLGGLFLCIGGGFTIPPAGVLGMITGSLLGEYHWRRQSYMTPSRSVLAGVYFAFLISLVIQIATWLFWFILGGRSGEESGVVSLSGPFSNVKAYLFWLGIPSALYVAAAGLYSRWLFYRQSGVHQN